MLNMPSKDSITANAQKVLDRVTGGKAKNIRMEVIPAESGRDTYEYSSSNGVLSLRGSSVVSLCRAFYDYAKANNMGQVSWGQSYLRLPSRWPDASATRVVTPFEIRHAYNVVTAGYTFPYWTWERWEQELDWQAVHGFNMLMAPVATEAIAERVWLKLGLTQVEIDEFTCGPAHLPWFRMGNICGIGGPLPKEWHADQVALQHKILSRMRELGMEPVVQSFAGFVPKGFSRIHPGSKLHQTSWACPKENSPFMLPPSDPQFVAITKSYMDEWKKEFGPARYFLVDSFNEMEIPKTERPETELLAEYGDRTWQAIRAADPDAIWAIQGWTFGSWKPENLKALFSKIPDDRMLIIDYGNDYGRNWDRFDAFFGKNWLFGYVPNMGGKTAYSGNLELYATGSAMTLKDPRRRNLKGFTISGEGLENNEAVYELLTDMAWRTEPANLDDWFRKYSANRYGSCPDAVAESWSILRKGCYANLQSYPVYLWQHNIGVDRNPNFFESAAKFLSVSDELKNSPAYRADALERTALALALRTDSWYELTKQASNFSDDALFEKSTSRVLELLSQIDRLMESHPYHRMGRWIEFARAHSTDPKLQDIYEANARCIVTYWNEGLQNYSCRVWGGLVRDYYREWLVREFASMKAGTQFDSNKFMIGYAKGRGTSSITPCADPVSDARTWLAQVLGETVPKKLDSDMEVVGQWHPGMITTEWKTVEWVIPPGSLPRIKGVHFKYTGGAHRLDIQSVTLFADGKAVAEEKHDGYAGSPDSRNIYRLSVPPGTTGNNGCQIRAVVKGNGGNDSKGSVGLLLEK